MQRPRRMAPVQVVNESANTRSEIRAGDSTATVLVVTAITSRTIRPRPPFYDPQVVTSRRRSLSGTGFPCHAYMSEGNHPTGSAAAGSSGSLRDATFRGVRWVALARVGAESFAFVSAVVLAHLIPPSEFGRAAVPLAIVPLAVILTFEGCAS